MSFDKFADLIMTTLLGNICIWSLTIQLDVCVVWGSPLKNVTNETYTNFLKQMFQIQVPEKLLMDRKAAFTASRFKIFL